MHPYLMSQVASEHIEDMRKRATAARRARQARGARRGLHAPAAASRPQPCPALTIQPA
jgi:hypothetical protein